MDAEELKRRTKQFGLDVIRLVGDLPQSMPAQVIGRQMLRSATSVGANYRAACRGRSKAEFIAKLGICIEEADESLYWMEVVSDTEMIPQGDEQLSELTAEANELVAILTTSVNTARKNSHGK